MKPGEVVGIIGRNGAGKSTLLKILSRVTEPTEGRVDLYGRVGSLLEVGTGFHPELTGRENIYLNGAILGMSRREIARKFDEIVAFAEIEKFIDTPVKRYSSGMYMRLAFAVAAHLEPEILVVDEVLAVGDAAFQKKCLGKMKDVAGRGRTVLFVSHNMAGVMHLCDRAVWLSCGQVRRCSDVDSVVKAYLSSGASTLAERTWPTADLAPGDDLVRLMGCRITQNGSVSTVIDINMPSTIDFDFIIKQNITNIITGINYYNSLGNCLFSNCDWRPDILSPGIYRKHVTVGGQLLPEGIIDVLVQLVFYDPMLLSVIERNALSFQAVDTAHPLSVRGLYKGEWPGIMRIGLRWSEALKVNQFYK